MTHPRCRSRCHLPHPNYATGGPARTVSRPWGLQGLPHTARGDPGLCAETLENVPSARTLVLISATGMRPPTEVGARALRFRRPARINVARLCARSSDPKEHVNDFPSALQGGR